MGFRVSGVGRVRGPGGGRVRLPGTPPTELSLSGASASSSWVKSSGSIYLPGMTKAVLTASDFTYLGALATPSDSYSTDAYSGDVRFGFTMPTGLTGRYVGGVPHLITTMSIGGGGWELAQPICELVLNQTPSMTLATAPRLPVYKSWGAVWGVDGSGNDRRRIINYDAGTPPNSSGGNLTRGLLWDEEENHMLWSTGMKYGIEHHRNLGATTFSGTSSWTTYGSWRTADNPKQANGAMVKIPSAYRSFFGGDDVLIIGVATSNNGPNTFGHSLRSFNSTGIKSIPHDVWDNPSDQSISTRQIMSSWLNDRMSRPATFRYCGWNDQLEGDPSWNGAPQYNCANGSWTTAPSGLASNSDSGLGLAWIENSTKHGLVFLSLFCDIVPGQTYPGDTMPHYWYANTNTCCHGHVDYTWQATGDGMTSYVPQLWIYDPDFVVTSTGCGGAVNPVAIASGHSSHVALSSYHANIPARMGYHGVGQWYDQVARKLYVMFTGQDNRSFEWTPLIHVFQVAD